MAPELIETLLVTADRSLPLLGRHLTRLAASAQALGYRCDEAAIERDILAAARGLAGLEPQRLRLLLERGGQYSIHTAPLAPLPLVQEILLSPEPLDSREPLLRYKTTFRPWYAKAADWLPAHPQIFDMVFFNEKGQLCEGSRSNLYLLLRGQWYTPPVECGLLPGVQRAELLEAGQVRERVLEVDDLRRAEGLRLSNALRGWIDVTLHDY
ncbi:aminotransferase class IV family protein [Bordetella hinzii]|uniref:Aminotransferase n=2 Tax=Bordetella hinzii TaxID=103855 RepID=A0AAN1VFZ9_9BORD|nr:aminotransferase class IV family protein [Bordetella hinzii]AKQ57088.1 putative branched-chain-amino-acid aminotransferase [Bordetella hinzii]AKQ61555.1 putative branched-chain-amino-acid aminotransferase [Bordetella hinzii]AZW17486.1 aminotransferase [Bordetella hinzii]KCB23948.1 para-aminobenzoate synthase, component I domain protein [Bordetella hinzii OH87 BAL007II]KCB31392.1 para-aminobenzoate synthase, component I domain protein [Bordetella hinzii CA90 BAL1384]